MSEARGNGDGERFIVRLPVWAIIDADIQDKKGLPHSIITLTSEAGKIIPIWRTEDAAAQYKDSLPVKRKGLLEMKTPRMLKTVLTEFKSAGGAYVGTDFLPGPYAHGQLHPIQEYLDALDKLDQSGP